MADGLLKSERLRRERKERREAEEEAVAALEPPFPYRMIAFDPAYFAIPAHPPSTLDG